MEAKGELGTPFTMSVERGKILEFAAATGSQNPSYWRTQQPVCPPTFLITQMFWEQWAGSSANPWNLVEMDQRRGLHAEQEFVFFGRPPRAGTVLSAQSRISGIETKRSSRGGELTFATMVTEFRDDGGRLVAESRMTAVEAPGPTGVEA